MQTEGLEKANNPSPEAIKEKVERILTKIDKPSRFIGEEIGSIKKDWEKSSVKTAIAFPDMYEVGVSNLGHRILYHLMNQEDFLADRVYAPSPDFRTKMLENNIPLYAMDSFRPISDFDVIAFSLQYELSYPTILAMLEMGNIPVENKDRNDSHPIIIAGGPGSYNPEPLSNFIDVFLIGDGEDVLQEFLKEFRALKSQNKSRDEILKALLKLDGLYIPKFYKAETSYAKPVPVIPEAPEFVRKRVSDFKKENYPVDFPVPYSPSVHDRAVVEIRRGCGRMCRFCQPCFVNMPVRERHAEEIIELTDQLLKNTGYEEYSLLSLSSNDYNNIEGLVCELNKKHAPKGASISLPSQRADSFSLDLANLVQTVRKSTLTFAPEAGSQRMRNVINKNLNQEQILNAILSTYKAGWTHAKLYFMIGLPTETFEDLDEIIKLLSTIKNESRKLKAELDLKKHLDLTCTVSIFVPKPFTPFQWCGQDNIEVINEKIRYLREKVKYLKGVKLNIHDSFLCQLEAVFSRGDRRLNDLIKKTWEKGSYLDAWDELFNKDLWLEAANEIGIDFHDYSSKVFDLNELKPWDIIKTGIDEEWLKAEYKKAFENSTTIPCDEKCAGCGACKEFPGSKKIRSLQNTYKNDLESYKTMFNRVPDTELQRYRLKISKRGVLKYISHLDWLSLIYRAVRKAGLNVAFTQGFNPSPKISLGAALPIFIESTSEYIDIELYDNLNENELMERLNNKLPANCQISVIVKISKDVESIDRLVEWAKYTAIPVDKEAIKKIDLSCIVKDIFLKDNIFIEKTTKKGLKKIIDIRPSINSAEVIERDDGLMLEFILRAGQGNSSKQDIIPLRADNFIKVITPDIDWDITRIGLLDNSLNDLL